MNWWCAIFWPLYIQGDKFFFTLYTKYSSQSQVIYTSEKSITKVAVSRTSTEYCIFGHYEFMIRPRKNSLIRSNKIYILRFQGRPRSKSLLNPPPPPRSIKAQIKAFATQKISEQITVRLLIIASSPENRKAISRFSTGLFRAPSRPICTSSSRLTHCQGCAHVRSPPY